MTARNPAENGSHGLQPEELQHELDLARHVQQSLYPATLPHLPGTRLAALNEPARIVSGDLFDVIKIDPERIVLLCADVSGKGFAAALLASEIYAYVRATLRAACVFADSALGPLPVQVVTLLNSEAVRRNESGRYATMFFAEFDSGERSLQYVNAGHNPPLLFTDTGRVIKLGDGGPPVGLLEDAIYDTGKVLVPDGSTVLIYTDGVVEARNPEDEEFGLARLIDVCAKGYNNIDSLLPTIMGVLRAWRGEREQGDDITLMALATSGSE
jgi:sigma-B regulation protein RsbU (phosphoserine phosphatase)